MKRKNFGILFALVLALGFGLMTAVPAAAATINVPGDYSTIQAAIGAASSGNTINVAAGTYNENITLKDGVELLGAGAGVTIIDGGDNGSVVTASNVGSATKLDGFTITHGSVTKGGGIYCEQSSPTISNCTFSANSASYGGGMSNYQNSSPTVTNCTFSGNSATNGGGMFNANSSPTVTNCTFSGNSATVGGGMSNYDSSSPAVTNCILWGDGQEIHNSGSTPVVTYCDIQGGYSGTGNINDDPLFVGGGDYHLQPGSPCIDAGDNTAVPGWLTTDFEGDPRIVDGVVDMGVDEYVALLSEAINIVGKDTGEAVSQIVFPPGLVEATVSTPFNNYDGSGDPQILSDTDSEPVVRLRNTSSDDLIVWLQITSWENGVVVSEDYELVDTGTDNVNEVDEELSSDGEASSVNTGITIPAGEYMGLYLEVVLNDLEGVSGGSTLIVLGEST